MLLDPLLGTAALGFGASELYNELEGGGGDYWFPELEDTGSPYEEGAPGWDADGMPIGRMPRGENALLWQYEANRRARTRRQALWNDATGALDQGANLLQSYRPGGSAALASGIHRQKAQMFGTQALNYSAPDLLIGYREEQRQIALKKNEDALRDATMLAAFKPLSGGLSALPQQDQGSPAAGAVDTAGGGPAPGGGGGPGSVPGGGAGAGASAQLGPAASQPAALGGGAATAGQAAGGTAAPAAIGGGSALGAGGAVGAALGAVTGGVGAAAGAAGGAAAGGAAGGAAAGTAAGAAAGTAAGGAAVGGAAAGGVGTGAGIGAGSAQAAAAQVGSQSAVRSFAQDAARNASVKIMERSAMQRLEEAAWLENADRLEALRREQGGRVMLPRGR